MARVQFLNWNGGSPRVDPSGIEAMEETMPAHSASNKVPDLVRRDARQSSAEFCRRRQPPRPEACRASQRSRSERPLRRGQLCASEGGRAGRGRRPARAWRRAAPKYRSWPRCCGSWRAPAVRRRFAFSMHTHQVAIPAWRWRHQKVAAVEPLSEAGRRGAAYSLVLWRLRLDRRLREGREGRRRLSHHRRARCSPPARRPARS